ncbi:MAG: hypothetical protein FWC16_11435 [Defluviitaleaceae bacterium]|nr:hypothetical protein [Defluviitaleaceae bacterium]MCL2275531.1 hypothetical protein [Defluviitaleaceae bacterium]
MENANHQLPEIHPDERLQKEGHVIYAKAYVLLLALTVIAVTVLLFFTRSIIVYLPAMLGTAWSLGCLILRYKGEGVLFSREKDERITEFKTYVKSKCYLKYLTAFCIGSMPLILFNNDVPPSIVWGVILVWFIPNIIAVIYATIRGLYAPGSKSETREKNKTLAKSTARSAILFGIFMAIVSGNVETFAPISTAIWQFFRLSVLYAVVWGVPFYFVMIGIDKVSEEFGDKRLANNENAATPTEAGDGE